MIYMSNSEKVEYENLFNFNKNPKSLIKKNIIEDIDNFNNFPLINNQKEESQNKKYSEPLLLINNEPLLIISDDDKEYFNLKDENNLKEEYLLSDDNNKIGSIQTLFNKTKMKDYSPLDLFKYQSQLINFCILCFLWAVYNFIKYGLDSIAKKILEYTNNIIWVLCIHIIGIINLYLIMVMYISNKRAFHKLLVSIQLITFIILLLALHLDNIRINKNIYIFSIVVAQIFWNCLYLLLILITLLIYPIMLRSKGLGWNIAFGTIGKLVVMFLVDLRNEHEYILYFLFFDFLLLVLSYGLPKKIGSFVLELSNYKEKKKNPFDIIKDEIESINYFERKLSY